jgi:hypothetical protein
VVNERGLIRAPCWFSGFRFAGHRLSFLELSWA